MKNLSWLFGWAIALVATLVVAMAPARVAAQTFVCPQDVPGYTKLDESREGCAFLDENGPDSDYILKQNERADTANGMLCPGNTIVAGQGLTLRLFAPGEQIPGCEVAPPAIVVTKPVTPVVTSPISMTVKVVTSTVETSTERRARWEYFVSQTTAGDRSILLAILLEEKLKVRSTSVLTIAVPAGDWTRVVTDNVILDEVMTLLPAPLYEGSFPGEGIYQLRTDYIDTDATTWKGGPRLYEYDISPGYSVTMMGVQGDTGVQLCYEAEIGAKGAQILMKTVNGNGTSAIVQVSKNGAPHTGTCP